MERSDNHLLKPAEVIQRLGVSRSWLYEAARSGRIPCVRLGGDDGPVRFPADDLEHWLEQARRDSRPGEPDPRAPKARTDRTAPRRRGRSPARSDGSEQLALSLLAPSDPAG